MRKFIIVILILSSARTIGQRKISGNYSSRLGQKIELKSDNTFTYNWRFDLASSWSKGNWRLENDTIFFNVVPIMDTLKIVKNNIVYDSLVLSSDQKTNLINPPETIVNALSGGGQNRNKPPQKLYFKNGKLYRLKENNKIDNKKHQQLSTGKKFKNFFYKSE